MTTNLIAVNMAHNASSSRTKTLPRGRSVFLQRLQCVSNFFKLMNNAIFAKSIDNFIKRENVKLVNDKTKLSKLAASPSFDSFRIFFENLAVVKMRK